MQFIHKQFFIFFVCSSLVMRDLTLRSAASFGSFHLIRLLYDEYIFYLIEQRVAKTTRRTPLQMLGEVSEHICISICTPATTLNFTFCISLSPVSFIEVGCHHGGTSEREQCHLLICKQQYHEWKHSALFALMPSPFFYYFSCYWFSSLPLTPFPSSPALPCLIFCLTWLYSTCRLWSGPFSD